VNVVSVFRWKDALDVLIVAVVVYRILVMMKGTRSAQMAIGLVALLAAAFAARSLDLYSTQWLFDHVWSFWVVVVVVLFQPELRRALSRIGQGRWLGTVFDSGAARRGRAVEEVARAAARLAERQAGALIIVERTSGLRQYAELGVALDALVSADLLESLFVFASPLHDGAVLVQGDRVVAAGCFLPLSRSTSVSRAFGTRHRAALGISEESDAVAVVVSEETGRLSLAVDGRLEPMLDEAALATRLGVLVEGRTPGRPSAVRGSRWRLLAPSQWIR
jgi:diadenylate cyclase